MSLFYFYRGFYWVLFLDWSLGFASYANAPKKKRVQKTVTTQASHSAIKKNRATILRRRIRRALRKHTLLSVYGTKGSGSLLLDALRSQKMLDQKLGSLSSFPFRKKSNTKHQQKQYTLALQRLIVLGKMSRINARLSLQRIHWRLLLCLRRSQNIGMFRSGLVSLQWHLRSDGRPLSVSVIKKRWHLDESDLDRCISKHIRHLLFPKLPVGASVTLQVSWRWSLH